MLTPGYHSFCISPYEYIIFDRTQVHCTAFLRFPGGPNVTEPSDSDFLCAVCRAAEATVYCPTDNSQFCGECDTASHTGDRSGHERLSIVDQRLQSEFCPAHPRRLIAFYCPECRSSVCRRCKTKGGKTDADGHLLVPIKRAYNQAVRSASVPDPVIASRRAVIARKMALCSAILTELEGNQERLEFEITRIAEEAIEQERLIAGEKALAVRSVQTELSRKLAEMEALQRSLADHRRKSGPLAFLRAASTQAEEIVRMETTADLPLDLSARGEGVKSTGRAFVQATRQRLGQLQRAMGEDEGTRLTRWVAAFVPGFKDLCTDFEDGISLIHLLQELRPGAYPSVPYPALPETPVHKRVARRAAIAFARELGITGEFCEETLCGKDVGKIIALVRVIQRELGGTSGRSSRRAPASP
jgi:hypothetical protein